MFGVVAVAGAQPPAAQAPATQTPGARAPAAPGAAAPDAAADADRDDAMPFGKRGECRAEAGGKRLRGTDRVDAIELCVAQARLDCLKKAIADKIYGPARTESVRRCIGK